MKMKNSADEKRNLLVRRAILNGKRVDIEIIGGKFARIQDEIRDSAVTECVDARNMLAFTPFYNCHAHSSMVLLRGLADDLELFTWLNEHIWPVEAQLTPEDICIGTRLAALEMIKSGTVFFNDSYFFPTYLAKAAEEMGIRASISLCRIDLVAPEVIRRNAEEAEKFFDAWKRGEYSSRITVNHNPHSIYGVNEAGLREEAARAEASGLPVHIHLAETAREVEECKEAHGGLTPVEYLREVGLLNERARLAHCVWLSDNDIRQIAESRAVVVVNATSNLKLVSGMCPIAKLMEAGARVTIGTDGCASNNAHSMFSEMKMAALVAKIQSGNPTAGAAPQILKAATAEGAKAFVADSGEIAVGKVADMMLIDPERPYFVGDYNWESNLVYAGESDCVDTVICDGRVLMRNRTVPGENEIIAAARKVCDRFRK